MEFVPAVLHNIWEVGCDLLSVTVEPSLTRMFSKKLGCTTCDISAVVTKGCHLLDMGRQQQVKFLITPKPVVKTRLPTAIGRLPAQRQEKLDICRRRRRKTCQKLWNIASDCGFSMTWESSWCDCCCQEQAGQQCFIQYLCFSCCLLGFYYEEWPEPAVRQGEGRAKFGYTYPLYE